MTFFVLLLAACGENIGQDSVGEGKEVIEVSCPQQEEPEYSSGLTLEWLEPGLEVQVTVIDANGVMILSEAGEVDDCGIAGSFKNVDEEYFPTYDNGWNQGYSYGVYVVAGDEDRLGGVYVDEYVDDVGTQWGEEGAIRHPEHPTWIMVGYARTESVPVPP